MSSTGPTTIAEYIERLPISTAFLWLIFRLLSTTAPRAHPGVPRG